MSKTERQMDLEETIAAHAQTFEVVNPFTGEIFKSKAKNHYEENDGKPVAPQVELNRPTIRQRIENLINRDPAVLSRYMMEGPPDGSEGLDLDIPDDPEAPLTASETNYIDMVAAQVAEAAPLPDDGLPRPEGLQTSEVPQTAPGAPGGGPGAVPAGGVSPPRPAPKGATPSTDPT